MNIERTSGPWQKRSLIGVSQTAPASTESKAEKPPQDSVTLSSEEVSVEIFKLKQGQWTDKLARHATKIVTGAGEGLVLGAMSNTLGPVGTTVTNGAIGGILGGVEGYRFGQSVGQKTENPEIESKLKRHFATHGALDGASNGLIKGGVVAGLTALTGGNLAVGMAAGVAVKYLL